LRCRVLRLGKKEVPIWHTGAWPHSSPYMKGSNLMASGPMW
jgi:hypothetical protein